VNKNNDFVCALFGVGGGGGGGGGGGTGRQTWRGKYSTFLP